MDILFFIFICILLFSLIKTTNQDRTEAEKQVSIENEEMEEYEIIEAVSEREIIRCLKRINSAKTYIEKYEFDKAKDNFEEAMDILENGVDFRIRKLCPPSACYIDYSNFLYSIGEQEKAVEVLKKYVDLCRECGDTNISLQELTKKMKNIEI